MKTLRLFMGATVMSGDNDQKVKEYEFNLDMWKHYDNLRQSKNQTFLTANTLLAAVIGFVLQGQQSNPKVTSINLPVSILGFAVCIFWFLLLSRNAEYIEFHRHQVTSLETEGSVKFATFSQWGKKKFRPWERLSSNLMDRLVAVSFGFFWLAVLVYFR